MPDKLNSPRKVPANTTQDNTLKGLFIANKKPLFFQNFKLP
jgi:hypothetical protein